MVKRFLVLPMHNDQRCAARYIKNETSKMYSRWDTQRNLGLCKPSTMPSVIWKHGFDRIKMLNVVIV